MTEDFGRSGRQPDTDSLVYASSIGTLVDRTNHWIRQGAHNVTRFLTGDLGYQEYREREADLLSGLRLEVLRGATGEVLLREGISELITRLRELDFRAATCAVGLMTLRRQLDAQLGHDPPRAGPAPPHQNVSAGL
jgi:phosphoserine phosphatase